MSMPTSASSWSALASIRSRPSGVSRSYARTLRRMNAGPLICECVRSCTRASRPPPRRVMSSPRSAHHGAGGDGFVALAGEGAEVDQFTRDVAAELDRVGIVVVAAHGGVDDVAHELTGQRRVLELVTTRTARHEV